jgi:succinoglycan biosynthesis transport protein ExoP
MQQQVMHEDEISLREIIETVWSGRWIIASVTAVAVLLSGIVSYFVLDPVYEVTTTVMVNRPDGNNQHTVQNLSSFAQQIQSDFVIGKIINKLEMDPEETSINSIRNSLKVEVVKDSNLIRITVNGRDPKFVTVIANVVALELGSFIEISTRLDIIVGFKKRLRDLEDQLKIVQSELDSANDQLENTPEKFTTQKTLSDDPYVQSVVADSSRLNNKNLGPVQMLHEEINPVYINLKNRIAEASIVLSKLLSEKQSLDERVTINHETIIALQNQIKSKQEPSQELLQSINRNNALLITPAVEPEFAKGPNKKLNVLIAAVIGAMLGVFVVFVKQYWRENIR